MNVNHFKRIQQYFWCWMQENVGWKICSGRNFIQYHPTWFFPSFKKCWMKSARLNGSNISSNIANFACWMKCWTRLSRPLYEKCNSSTESHDIKEQKVFQSLSDSVWANKVWNLSLRIIFRFAMSKFILLILAYLAVYICARMEYNHQIFHKLKTKKNDKDYSNIQLDRNNSAHIPT